MTKKRKVRSQCMSCENIAFAYSTVSSSVIRLAIILESSNLDTRALMTKKHYMVRHFEKVVDHLMTKKHYANRKAAAKAFLEEIIDVSQDSVIHWKKCKIRSYYDYVSDFDSTDTMDDDDNLDTMDLDPVDTMDLNTLDYDDDLNTVYYDDDLDMMDDDDDLDMMDKKERRAIERCRRLLFASESSNTRPTILRILKDIIIQYDLQSSII